MGFEPEVASAAVDACRGDVNEALELIERTGPNAARIADAARLRRERPAPGAGPEEEARWTEELQRRLDPFWLEKYERMNSEEKAIVDSLKPPWAELPLVVHVYIGCGKNVEEACRVLDSLR
jgi:hypothetical protein